MELRQVGITELGGINLDTKSLELLNPFPPGDLHQKFLASLEGKRIKAKISRTRNKSGGG